MRKLTFISSVVFVLLCPGQAGAALDQASASVRQQYNEAVDRIYSRFVQLKDQYPELRDFSRDAVSRDENGFDAISYLYDAQGQYGYRFSLRVQDLDQDASVGQNDARQLRFPLLRFEVAVESKRLGESATFNPNRIVDENFQDLRVLEQGYLPFRLELKADKDVYKAREQITLTVSLKNKGSLAFRVADLNEQSLYCEIDDKVWGNKGAAGELKSVLKPYGSLSKILKVEGISASKQAQITCTYGLGFKGVQPYSRIKVSVQP